MTQRKPRTPAEIERAIEIMRHSARLAARNDEDLVLVAANGVVLALDWVIKGGRSGRGDGSEFAKLLDELERHYHRGKPDRAAILDAPRRPKGKTH